MAVELLGARMRSLSLVALDRLDLAASVLASGPDAVMLDLADTVAPSRKDLARANVRKYLDAHGTSAVALVRVATATEPQLLAGDLDAAVVAGVAGIILPEAEYPDQIRDLADRISTLEHERGIAGGSVAILPFPETAVAIRNYYDILTASARVRAALFASAQGGDLSRDIGYDTGGSDGVEILYMRSKVVLDARAAGIEHIFDGAWLNVSDTDGFERDTTFSRRLGYTGRFAFNQAQTEIVNRVFTPSEEEVTAAEEEIRAFYQADRDGVGIFEHNGRLVDIATVKYAQRILAKAGRPVPPSPGAHE